MEINDYKKIIEKTAIFPTKVDNFGLAYCYLGLIGETDELVQAINNSETSQKEFDKEFGDVIWYTTAMSNILNLDIDCILESVRTTDYLTYMEITDNKYAIVSIAENLKKFYRDGRQIDNEFFTKCLLNNLLTLKYFENQKFKFNLDKILELNYNKLIKRRETGTLQGDGDNREENIS